MFDVNKCRKQSKKKNGEAKPLLPLFEPLTVSDHEVLLQLGTVTVDPLSFPGYSESQ